jgi:hypothetical protein
VRVASDLVQFSGQVRLESKGATKLTEGVDLGFLFLAIDVGYPGRREKQHLPCACG